MRQEKNLKLEEAAVFTASRGQKFVTCPHCWTDQRTERDFCYRCETEFVYLDEIDQERASFDTSMNLCFSRYIKSATVVSGSDGR